VQERGRDSALDAKGQLLLYGRLACLPATKGPTAMSLGVCASLGRNAWQCEARTDQRSERCCASGEGSRGRGNFKGPSGCAAPREGVRGLRRCEAQTPRAIRRARGCCRGRSAGATQRVGLATFDRVLLKIFE
jgi:hypothetical protein